MVEVLTTTQAETAEEIVQGALSRVCEDNGNDPIHLGGIPPETRIESLGGEETLDGNDVLLLIFAIEKLTGYESANKKLPIVVIIQEAVDYAQQCLDGQSPSQSG